MQILTLGPAGHRRVVLFADGADGDQQRHLPLLKFLVAQECQVIAPFFARQTPGDPAPEASLTRLAGLIEALGRSAKVQ